MVSVVGRDGQAVPFEPERVAEAIYRASREVGAPDKFLAEELAEAVAGHLRRHHSEAPPGMDKVQELVERALVDTGHTAVAHAYARALARRADAREQLRVRRRTRRHQDATDAELLVHPMTSEELVPWSKARIVTALQVEAGTAADVAEEIAAAVEEKVFGSGLERISTGLVRALVDNELFERGHTGELSAQQLVGLPTYDLERMILSRSRENSTVSSHNPEAVARAISAQSLRRYALRQVFSPAVASAHLEGRLHIHGLGQALKLGAVVHDLADLARHGLDFQGIPAVSAPPRHAGTLTAQLQTHLRAMSSWFAGPQGIAHLNLAYAPFLLGATDEQLYQEAQNLLYATAQNGGANGGRALAVDFNLVTRVPRHLLGRPLVGPGGELTADSAESHLPVARRFARAILLALGDGDVRGAPFPFPRCFLPVALDGPDREVEEPGGSPGETELLAIAAGVAGTNGSVIFWFDREGADGAQPLPAARPSGAAGATACHGQTITINVPQLVARAVARHAVQEAGDATPGLPGFERPSIAGVDLATLQAELREIVELAVKACAQRRQLLKRLAASADLPLWEAVRSRAGTQPGSRAGGRAGSRAGSRAAAGGRWDGAAPRVDFSRLECHIGVIGMAEALEAVLGEQGADPAARQAVGTELADRILASIGSLAVTQGEPLGLVLRLVEAPCESASRRLARIDLRRHEIASEAASAGGHGPPVALPLVRGDVATGAVYYSRGTCLPVDTRVPVSQRLRREGLTQRLAPAGAMAEIHPGWQELTTAEVERILRFAADQTTLRALAFSPLLLVCEECDTTSREPGDTRESGAWLRCPCCYSYGARLATRIAGYFGSVADANPSKVVEVGDRGRVRFELDAGFDAPDRGRP